MLLRKMWPGCSWEHNCSKPTIKGITRVRGMFCYMNFDQIFAHIPADIWLFKTINEKTRTMCDICSKLIIKTEQGHWWLVHLFLTLKRFHTLFWYFHRWFWTSKLRLCSFVKLVEIQSVVIFAKIIIITWV